MNQSDTTPNQPQPQRITDNYPPFPFWAYHISRDPEATMPGYWVRLIAPATRGRDWPFQYWLPDQPEKPTMHYPFAVEPQPDGLPRIILRFVEDEMVTLHRDGKYLETLYMSCPEQANDFKIAIEGVEIYSLDGWFTLREEFQKNWKTKYDDSDGY